MKLFFTCCGNLIWQRPSGNGKQRQTGAECQNTFQQVNDESKRKEKGEENKKEIEIQVKERK